MNPAQLIKGGQRTVISYSGRHHHPTKQSSLCLVCVWLWFWFCNSLIGFVFWFCNSLIGFVFWFCNSLIGFVFWFCNSWIRFVFWLCNSVQVRGLALWPLGQGLVLKCPPFLCGLLVLCVRVMYSYGLIVIWLWFVMGLVVRGREREESPEWRELQRERGD